MKNGADATFVEVNITRPCILLKLKSAHRLSRPHSLGLITLNRNSFIFHFIAYKNYTLMDFCSIACTKVHSVAFKMFKCSGEVNPPTILYGSGSPLPHPYPSCFAPTVRRSASACSHCSYFAKWPPTDPLSVVSSLHVTWNKLNSVTDFDRKFKAIDGALQLS